MSGPIQSSDYVPGISGWKLDQATGEFEINQSRPSLSADAQMIIVVAGEWSEYDLPANAIERYAFIGAEVAKIPAEYRDNAELTTKDFSFDCDGSDVRTTLSYTRLENQDEVVARLEKARVAGTSIVRAGGCTTIICDGVVQARFGNLDAPLPDPEQPQPFKVEGDKVYLNEAFIREAVVTNANIGFYVPIPGVYVDANGRVRINREDLAVDAKIDGKLTANWSIRMQINANGQYVAAGVGLGISDGFDSQFLASADAFAIKERSAQEVLEKISTVIGESSLSADLESPIPGIVLDTIRAELRPGGLLHRSR